MRRNDTDPDVDTDLGGGAGGATGPGPVTSPPPPVAPATPMAWGAAALAAPGSLGPAPRLTAIGKPVGSELWWVGADGSVTGVWTQPGDAWASYSLAGPGSAAPSGDISAISKGGDVMEVWWVGADGSVQAAYHEGGWQRYELAGAGSASLTGGISGIFKGGDVMEVWWVGADGSVQAAYHEGGWQRYELAGAGSASLTGGISGIFKGGDVMEVWWVGADGSVQAAYHEGGWQRYELAGAGSAAATTGVTAVAKGGDLMEVWWVGADTSLQAAYHDGGWQRYELAAAGVASPTCRPSSWFGQTRQGVTMRVWWISPAGDAWQASYDGAWANRPIGSGVHLGAAIAGFAANSETVGVVWGGVDGSLVDAIPDEVTLVAHLAGGRALRGVVGLTLRADGSSEWWGDVTNDTFYGYNYAVSAFPYNSGLRVDLAGAHQGHVAGYAEPGSSDDLWSVPHPAQAALAGALGSFRFGSLAVRLEHSVDLIDYLEVVINDLFEVAAGVVMLKIGAVIVIGAEVVSLIATGSLVPGAVLAGGVPWLSGPAGIFVRVLTDVTGDSGRYLTAAEYDWANDMVFAGALPPIDTLRLTAYKGASGRPFTFPTFNGPTLLNVGSAMFANVHSDETTFIHELVHACQIAHSTNVVFTAVAMATQAKNSIVGGVYDYGAAGFDYTDLGLEGQAQVVSDWFRGSPEFPQSPDPRNHTGHARDPQSPYYRYLTDNVRVGHF